MGTVLTATACFGGTDEPVSADVAAVEANLRRLGARCLRARVDKRRGRLEATLKALKAAPSQKAVPKLPAP